MSASLRGILLSLLLATVCYSQDPPPEPEAPTEVIQWSIAPDVVHPNIHFILDRSGSMNADQISSAMGCFLYIAQQSLDEINISITVFGTDAKRWEGCPDDNTPKNWAALPSDEAVKAARKWIAEVEINSSSTHLEEALKTVDRTVINRTGGDIKEVTVIVISDLCFDAFPGALTQQIEEIRDQRQKAGCRDVNFGFVGIHTSQTALTKMREVCEQLRCWMAFIERAPVAADEDEPQARPAARAARQQAPTGPAPAPDPDPMPPAPDPNPFPH